MGLSGFLWPTDVAEVLGLIFSGNINVLSEFSESSWNALTILSQEAKFSENFIQKAQMVQKHKNIFLYPISSQLLLRRVGVKEDYLWCGQTVVSDTAFWESCRF